MRRFGTSHATGRRSVPRTAAPLVAVLSTSAGDHPAALVDVSRTGARLSAEVLPAIGDELTFRAEDIEAFGDVVWCEAHQCAIEFDTPIAVSEVKRLRLLGSIVGQFPPGGNP